MFSFQNNTAFLLLLFVVFSLISSISSKPSFITHICNPKTETANPTDGTANATYKSSLTVLLNSLSSKASQNYSFHNESSNIGIYALFLCRGDVSNSTCQSCVSFATQDIMSRCPSTTSAIIWYDECMLRFANVNFLGKASKVPSFPWSNPTSTDQQNVDAISLLYRLIGRVRDTDTLYESDVEEVTLKTGPTKSYGLVQCTRDIDGDQCGQCLSGLMEEALKCCKSRLG